MLRRLAATAVRGMRPPSILVANFGRGPYVVPPAKQLREGWQPMRQFVRVEHAEHAHIIDNKLMDLVRLASLV